MFLDVFVILLVIITIISCFKKGFALSLFNALSSISSVVILVFFSKPFITAVKTSPWGVDTLEKLRIYVEKEFVSQSTKAIDASNMPVFLKGFMYNQTDSLSVVAQDVADKIFGALVTVASFLVLALIIKILLHFIPKVLKIIMKLPLIHQLDKLLGLAVGALLGVLWSVVAAYAVGLLSLIPSLSFLDEQLSTSTFLQILNNLNIGIF